MMFLAYNNIKDATICADLFFTLLYILDMPSYKIRVRKKLHSEGKFYDTPTTFYGPVRARWVRMGREGKKEVHFQGSSNLYR